MRAGWLVCFKCRDENEPTDFGAWVRGVGLSHAFIAEMTGVSTATVVRARRGDPVYPRAARALSELSGVPFEQLRCGVDPPSWCLE